jgi:hypothetical protein
MLDLLLLHLIENSKRPGLPAAFLQKFFDIFTLISCFKLSKHVLLVIGFNGGLMYKFWTFKFSFDADILHSYFLGYFSNNYTLFLIIR